LNIEDILMDDSMSAFTLVLKSSKTDPFWKGIHIRIFKTDQLVCPVKSMIDYLRLRKSRINGNRTTALFVDESGNPMTRYYIINKYLKC
jgi:hypothetical protein